MHMSDDECEFVLGAFQKVNSVVMSLAEKVLTSDKPPTPTERGMLKAYTSVIKYARDEIKCIAKRLGRDVPYYLFDPIGTKLSSVGKQAEVSDELR